MKASDTQVGGKHYKDMVIQPAEFCQRNRLNWCEANVVKYICRHADKKGAEDLQKAKHYIDLLLEWEYSPTDASSSPVKDATAESLCLTCGRDPGCVGDYPRTKGGGCEGYTPSLRERMLGAKVSSLCFSCSVKGCEGATTNRLICSVYVAKDQSIKPAPVALAICPSCAEHPGCKGQYYPTDDGSCNGYSEKGATSDEV